MRWCAIGWMSWVMVVSAALPVVAAAPATAPTSQTARAKAQAARAVLDRAARTPPEWVLEIKPVKRVEVTLAYLVTVPQMEVREWTFFAPVPPELTAQRDIVVTTRPEGERVEESSAWKRPVVRVRQPAGEATRKKMGIVQTYRMELMARKLVPARGKRNEVEELSDGLRRLATSASATVDFEGEVFQGWLDRHALRPRAAEDEIAFGRRVFLFLKNNMKYDFRPDLDRRAGHVCGEMLSDCGGLGAVFVGTMRAAGVPARLLVGRWAESSQESGKLNGHAWQQEHVRAEFYAQRVGWVPVDLSVAVNFDRGAANTRNFGNDRGDFVVMHTDTDLELETGRLGKRKVQWLQSPVFWVTGKGTVEGWEQESSWLVKEER